MKTPFGTEVTGDATRSKRRRFVPLAIGGVVLSLVVGSAFAASITINSDADIEFGQGNQAVVTCATGDLQPTITSAYDTTSDTFSVASVVVTGVGAGCVGKYILVSLYQGATLADQILFSPTDAGSTAATSFTLDSEASAGCTDLATSVCDPEDGTNDGRKASVDATTVDDFTVETFETAPTTTV